MKETIYLVGGAVRDKFMGIEPKDRDYVVVGSTPEKMLARGFKQVGADFPVFLHPETGDEYALARIERKTSVGYSGFEVDWKDVTIEQDLARRDLTINSIAINVETNEVVDPFNGIDDISNKKLRPTTIAFAEDPIRVLRAGRFLARWPEFEPTDELIVLSRQIASEIHQCSPERVWLELEKVFSETKPSNFFRWVSIFNIFDILKQMGHTPQKSEHHPEIWVDIHTFLVMDYAAKHYGDPEIVFACFVHDFGKPVCYREYGNAYGHEDAGVDVIIEFCKKWKVPNNFRDLGLLVCKHHTKIHTCMSRGSNSWSRPATILKLFTETNALSKTHRFGKILMACIADARGRGADSVEVKQYEERPYPQADYLVDCLEAVKSVDTKQISLPLLEKGVDGKLIGERIRQERIAAIRKVQNIWREKYE